MEANDLCPPCEMREEAHATATIGRKCDIFSYHCYRLPSRYVAHMDARAIATDLMAQPKGRPLAFP
eukprot:scaffold149698_cov31-Tisochrysis_lutea.AAC.1